MKQQSKNRIIDNRNDTRDKNQGSSNDKSTIIVLDVTNGILLLILLILIILFIIYKTTMHAIESDGNEGEEEEFETFDDKEENDINKISEDDRIIQNEEELLDMNDSKDPESIDAPESLEEEDLAPLMNPNDLEVKNIDINQKNQDITAFNEKAPIIHSALTPSEDQDHEMIDSREIVMPDDQTRFIPSTVASSGSHEKTEMFDQTNTHDELINEQDQVPETNSVITTSPILQSFNAEHEINEEFLEKSPELGIDNSAEASTNRRRKKR